MRCEQCGGLVTWRGPFHALTHTECHSCGGVNCQVVDATEPDEEDAPYQSDVQAAFGGPVQTPQC
jgi:hypothetical protein